LGQILFYFRRTGQTTLKNTEEYPPAALSTGVAAGFDDVDGSSYPALPLPARRTTLLPGQTYPEPLSSGTNILLAHSHTVSVLREAFSPPAVGRLGAAAATAYQPPPHHAHHHHHHHLHHHNHTFTVHARKVETTLAGQLESASGGRILPVISNEKSDSPGLARRPQQQQQQEEELKPPLFPKQYYYSVKQRLGENSDSPAVPRKLKPTVSLSPSTSASLSPGQAMAGLRAASPQSLNNESNSSFETGGGHASDQAGHPSGFLPYKETTKPFEMADFYK
jgi:hypothetical protein